MFTKLHKYHSIHANGCLVKLNIDNANVKIGKRRKTKEQGKISNIDRGKERQIVRCNIDRGKERQIVRFNIDRGILNRTICLSLPRSILKRTICLSLPRSWQYIDTFNYNLN
jgi:hypothetical protein